MNTLAPYILTALIERPKRLVYLSSGLHQSGDISLQDLTWEHRAWRGLQAYSDTKLHDVLLAFAVARHWPDVFSNALEPGWVATKMGGAGATDDLDAGHRTQVWLAVSDDPAAMVTGEYFYHMRPRTPKSPVPATSEVPRGVARGMQTPVWSGSCSGEKTDLKASHDYGFIFLDFLADYFPLA